MKAIMTPYSRRLSCKSRVPVRGIVSPATHKTLGLQYSKGSLQRKKSNMCTNLQKRLDRVKKPARGTLPRRPAQPSQSSFTQQVAARNPTPRDPLHMGAPYAFAMASSTAVKNPLLVIVAPVTASTWVDPASTTAAGSTLSASPPSEGVSLFSSTSTFWMAPSA